MLYTLISSVHCSRCFIPTITPLILTPISELINERIFCVYFFRERSKIGSTSTAIDEIEIYDDDDEDNVFVI